MKQRSLFILLFLLLTSMTACTAGHDGGKVIAYLRDGQLWTIDPNGANAFAVVTPNTPIISYSWSPTHQLLAFRALDQEFAQSSAAKQLSGHPVTGLIGDTPATINTIGVDGGASIPTALSSAVVPYSNAIWNQTGTRLLYRQTSKPGPKQPDGAIWWMAQNDQPGGIAAKFLPYSYSIPAFSYASSRIVGNRDQGIFTATIAGTDPQTITQKALPGHPLPASLERVLWQPGGSDEMLLYAIADAVQQTETPTIQLLLYSLKNKQTTTLATGPYTQFAWSPDGKHVLYSTGSTYTIMNINDRTSFNIPVEEESVPYWSPNGQFLLIDGVHRVTLVQIASQQQTVLLSDTTEPAKAATKELPPPNALLQPVANSVWSPDGSQFLFLTRDRLLWQGEQLSSGKGLYTVTINSTGQIQGAPSLVTSENITQPGWSYQDANTSFLY